MLKPMKNLATSMLLVFGTASVHAAVILDVQQVGANVFASGGGSINLTDLSSQGSATGAGSVWAGFPSGSALVVGPTSHLAVNFYKIISGPKSFGAGGLFLANSGSGDLFGVFANSGLYVRDTYISGSALSATSEWDNATLGDLGLTIGNYVWTWGSGANEDSFTLNIRDPRIATVPEPTSLALLGLGIAGLLLRRNAKQA